MIFLISTQPSVLFSQLFYFSSGKVYSVKNGISSFLFYTLLFFPALILGLDLFSFLRRFIHHQKQIGILQRLFQRIHFLSCLYICFHAFHHLGNSDFLVCQTKISVCIWISIQNLSVQPQTSHSVAFQVRILSQFVSLDASPDRITVLTKPGCLLIMNFSTISLKGQMTGTEIVKILLTGKIKESNLSIREDKFCTFSCIHDGFFPL